MLDKKDVKGFCGIGGCDAPDWHTAHHNYERRRDEIVLKTGGGMSQFMLIFVAFATVLLCALVLRSGIISAPFGVDSAPVASSEEHGVPVPNDRVRFTVTPQPVRAMELLSFRVDLKEYSDQQSVIVDLSMPNMIMGINQVTMKKSSPGVYEGQAIIPTCTTGRTLWQARVIVDNQVAGNFFFDVH